MGVPRSVYRAGGPRALNPAGEPETVAVNPSYGGPHRGPLPGPAVTPQRDSERIERYGGSPSVRRARSGSDAPYSFADFDFVRLRGARRGDGSLAGGVAEGSGVGADSAAASCGGGGRGIADTGGEGAGAGTEGIGSRTGGAGALGGGGVSGG
jgi:hypothetical protein